MELGLEPYSVASMVNFLLANFPLPTSDPFEGPGDPTGGEEGGKGKRRCSKKERQGANTRNRKEGEHTFHGTNAEP